MTGAELDFKNVSLLRKITIDDLHLKYVSAGGHDDFSGETQLSLPSTVVSGVEGAFRMVDGSLTMAKLVLTGNVPLYGALTLTKLGGEIDLAPKKVIKGFIDLSAGPKIDGSSVLGMENEEIDYTFPSGGTGSGSYEFSGDLTALGKTLGHGDMTADNGIVKVNLTLGSNNAGFKLGKYFTANGSIAGAIHGTAFTVRGNVHLVLSVAGHTYPVDGVLVVSNNGIDACAPIPALGGNSGLSTPGPAKSPPSRATAPIKRCARSISAYFGLVLPVAARCPSAPWHCSRSRRCWCRPRRARKRGTPSSAGARMGYPRGSRRRSTRSSGPGRSPLVMRP